MQGDIQLGRRPNFGHMNWPDHWQVMSTEAALGDFLYATHVVFHDPHQRAVIHWESRQHRKGRPPQSAGGQHAAPAQQRFPKLIGLNLKDISWWIAAIYMLGSCVWILNGAVGFFMLGSKTVNTYVNGYTALFGTICFQSGGICLMLEALKAEPEVRMYHIPGGSSVAIPDKPGQQGSRHGVTVHADNVQPQRQGQLPESSAVIRHMEDGSNRSRVDGQNCYSHAEQRVSMHLDKTCSSSPTTSLSPSSSSSSNNNFMFQQQQQKDSQLVLATTPQPSLNSRNVCLCHQQPWQQQHELTCLETTNQEETNQEASPCLDIVLDPQPNVSSIGMDRGSSETGSSNEDKGPEQTIQSTLKLSRLQKFRWWGFKWRDVGWLASFVQLVSSTLFSISNVVAVPGILPKEDDTNYALWDGLVWAFYLAGSVGFVISSSLFTLETQKRWWQPRPFNLGWNAGFWNLLGSINFTLSAVFGFFAAPEAQYQHWGLNFSTIWGSCFFLLGSYLHLVEAINKD